MITSNSNAETAGNNSFSTGTITQSNLENNADFSGESFGGDASVSKNESGKYGLTRSAGYGATEFSQSSTTNSGINTANIEITDSETQQALTGENTTQAIANIATTTTTETAIVDSGALNNNFDQAEVEEFVNNQQAITQAFDKNVTALKGLVNSQLTELKEQLESGEINQAQFNDKTETLQNYNLLLGTIGAVVGTPTNSLLGQAAAAASPTVSYAIGQYFKDIAANNHNGQLTGGEEAAHVLAHGVLAAAVAASGGNDGLTAGVTAATSEAAAPLLASWLYGSENGSDLTSDQKETIAAILGLASTAVGASTGDLNNAVAAGQASDTAIDNNFLGGESLEALKEAREGRMSIEDARKILELDYINQHSDQLLDKYKTDPDSLSTEEKIKLESYITTFYNEQVEIYGVEDALKITSLLFSDEPKWQDSALDYNFPWALDSEAKEDALSNLDVKWTDYFTLDGIREVSDNEQLNQQANSLLVFNAVQQSQAQMGDLISLATGVGEAAIAARSLIALYKSKGLWGKVDDVVEGFWTLEPTTRGIEIEKHLALTDYKDWYNVGSEYNGYFPLVDFQKGNTLVSLKTVDTNGKTWMSRMQNHIDDLATRIATIDNQPANMVLDLRVQPGGINSASSLIQYGREIGVTVIIK
ncbi:VENN motif pre-toxin domain-containing protein [Psychromonas algicola]|uniref:VENN motif pre-toxin domain-containing protein n=1 Tax=Psychromonas algicola TaxID=2555642 RepID=UPI0010686C79|nr:VENN motif pre-toxin domain-containing protein [Psychromonas sp. RZ5]TEW50611.1 hypothetical protein E2R67_09040 [Psychromonas sp. RZ5]